MCITTPVCVSPARNPTAVFFNQLNDGAPVPRTERAACTPSSLLSPSLLAHRSTLPCRYPCNQNYSTLPPAGQMAQAPACPSPSPMLPSAYRRCRPQRQVGRRSTQSRTTLPKIQSSQYLYSPVTVGMIAIAGVSSGCALMMALTTASIRSLRQMASMRFSSLSNCSPLAPALSQALSKTRYWHTH